MEDIVLSTVFGTLTKKVSIYQRGCASKWIDTIKSNEKSSKNSIKLSSGNFTQLLNTDIETLSFHIKNADVPSSFVNIYQTVSSIEKSNSLDHHVPVVFPWLSCGDFPFIDIKGINELKWYW